MRDASKTKKGAQYDITASSRQQATGSRQQAAIDIYITMISDLIEYMIVSFLHILVHYSTLQTNEMLRLGTGKQLLVSIINDIAGRTFSSKYVIQLLPVKLFDALNWSCVNFPVNENMICDETVFNHKNVKHGTWSTCI